MEKLFKIQTDEREAEILVRALPNDGAYISIKNNIGEFVDATLDNKTLFALATMLWDISDDS